MISFLFSSFIIEFEKHHIKHGSIFYRISNIEKRVRRRAKITEIRSVISFIVKDQHTKIKGEVSCEFDVISKPKNVFVNTNKTK